MMRNEEQNNKPVTGYPYPPPSAHSSNYNPNPYPTAQNCNYNTNTNTGYPYTAPPPANYYTSNPYPAHSPYPTQDPQRAAFFRRMLILIISSFIILGVLSFIVWLVLRPQLPEFEIDSATVSPFNVSTSSSQVSGNWDIGFMAKNPNKKMSIYYASIQGGVLYGRQLLSETSLAPFYQDKMNETKFGAKFASSSSYVGEFLSKKLDGERKLGTVNFNVRLRGWVRFRTGAWRGRVRFLTVLCEDVSIVFSSNSGLGTLAGGPKKCQVFL